MPFDEGVLSRLRLKLVFVAKYIWDRLLYWTNQETRTTEQFLSSLEYFSNRIGFLTFLGALGEEYRNSVDVKNGQWIPLRIEAWLTFVLILFFGLVYFLSRHSVKRELAIGKKLFPLGRIPEDWPGNITNRTIIAASVLVFLALYVFLAWNADKITIASLCMVLISCNDFRTRYLINNGIRKYFGDDNYSPNPGDGDYEAIERRRAIVREFLFIRPHLWKEAARIIGSSVSFGIAVIGWHNNNSWLDVLAYGVLILTLLVNEYYTQKWRLDRRRSLRAIG
jgi:hypothetical protein